MQTIKIEVKDNYVSNVFEILHNLKGVMIEKIKFDESDQEKKIDIDLIKLQVNSMQDTWSNNEDEVWDEL